jgi:pimeloyl-ACP methyl ester carboxylesterase
MTALTAALGAQRFILFGVCSGADNSLATALVDDRVTAIVLVDPHTYPTRRSQLRYLRARVAERGGARDAARWGLAVAVRRLRQLTDRLGRPADSESSSGGRERPPIEIFRSQLTALVDRGVRVLAIYSGIHGAGYNDRDQLFELFPELRGRIDHMYFAGANHTFTELGVQAELIDAVTAWITKRFG